MIWFRICTIADRGIGHWVRCDQIAQKLLELNFDVGFIVDEYSPKLTPYMAKSVSVVHDLYCLLGSVPGTEEDAKLAINIIAKTHDKQPILVVDHYELGLNWESRIKQALPAKLIVIDDLQRSHNAELVIDARLSTTPQSYNGIDAYLGPDYASLSASYRNSVPQHSRDTNTILFSLGGGGDAESLIPLINDILLSPDAGALAFRIVVGPRMVNKDKLLALDSHPQITLLESPQSLYKEYCQCSLFVGALGTSLYELAATRTPAITFSVASNQQNDEEMLEKLGHFFHFERLPENTDSFAKLIILMVAHSNRLVALRQTATHPVDGRGSERIAQLIAGLPVKPSKVPSLEATVEQPHTVVKDSDICVLKVTDRHINQYLNARNGIHNSWRMTVKDTIPKLEHYLWWFNQSRHSYVIRENSQNSIFIWHESKRINQTEFLIGGWFSAYESSSPMTAMFALEWQLKKTLIEHPNAIWIAVINKANKFVNLLNKRAGFISTNGDQELDTAIQICFPKANKKEFNYVFKPLDKTS